MSDETKLPPALPGEVWRGVVGKYLCAVADPSAEPAEEPGGEGLWCLVPDTWGRTHMARWWPAEAWQWAAILRAWALHERNVAAAERALRKMADAAPETRGDELTWDTWSGELAKCEAALRALGVEP